MPGQGIGISDRVSKTTLAKWQKRLSVQTIQRYPFLSMLKAKGRIKHVDGGGEFRWIVQYRDHPLGSFIDMDAQDFSRQHLVTNANLPWRSYSVKDVISEREKLENGGEAAIIKILARRDEMMRRGAARQLAGEWFKDGNLAANAAREDFHGIESFMSIGTQTATDDLATSHDDSYAGLSTAVGGLGSDAESARVWTPVVVNCGKQDGSGNTLAWENYADEYIRLGALEASYGAASEDNIDTVLLTKTAFRQLLNILDDKERIIASKGASQMAKLGFSNFIELDGVEIGWDAGVPSGDGSTAGGSNTASAAGDTVYGYGFNFDMVSLMLLGKGKDLWKVRMTFNDDFQADRIFMGMVGNLCFESPRHFVKFADISAHA